MAAIFIPYQSGDVFKTGLSATEVVSIDFLNSVVSPKNLIIYTDVSAQLAETIQYFLTFDDVIRYIYFGKGVGNVTVNGMIFADSNETITNSVQSVYQAYGGQRGQLSSVSIGGYACQAVPAGMNCAIMAEPDTMAQFSVNLSIVKDNLGSGS